MKQETLYLNYTNTDPNEVIHLNDNTSAEYTLRTILINFEKTHNRKFESSDLEDTVNCLDTAKMFQGLIKRVLKEFPEIKAKMVSTSNSDSLTYFVSEEQEPTECFLGMFIGKKTGNIYLSDTEEAVIFGNIVDILYFYLKKSLPLNYIIHQIQKFKLTGNITHLTFDFRSKSTFIQFLLNPDNFTLEEDKANPIKALQLIDFYCRIYKDYLKIFWCISELEKERKNPYSQGISNVKALENVKLFPSCLTVSRRLEVDSDYQGYGEGYEYYDKVSTSDVFLDLSIPSNLISDYYYDEDDFSIENALVKSITDTLHIKETPISLSLYKEKLSIFKGLDIESISNKMIDNYKTSFILDTNISGNKVSHSMNTNLDTKPFFYINELLG